MSSDQPKQVAVANPDQPLQASGPRPGGGDEPTLASRLTLFVTVVSLASVVLCLAGLGVALSVEASFGMPHAAVFGSAFELLQLSVWGMSQLVIGLGEALSNVTLYLRLMTDVGVWILIGTLIAWVLLVGIVRLATRSRTEPGTFKRWLQMPSFKTETTGRLLAHGLLYSVLMSVFGPLLTMAAIVAVAFACVIVAILPLVTMAAGQAYIRDYVVKPNHCVALMDRATRMARYEQKRQAKEEKNDKAAPSAALCVRVIVGDGDRYEGRVVFAAASSVVLYDPRTGDVRRVPLSDGVMEVVPDLPSSP